MKLDDLSLRKAFPRNAWSDARRCCRKWKRKCRRSSKAVESYALNSYYQKAFDLDSLRQGAQCVRSDAGKTGSCAIDMAGTPSGRVCLIARRLIEAGTRFVQMNWPAVANGNPTVDAWDTHAANFGPLRDLHCPKLDSGLSALLEDLDQRGLLKETLVVAIGEFGRSPRLGVSTSGNGNAPDGRDHWPYCYTALMAGAGSSAGRCTANPMRPARPLPKTRSIPPNFWRRCITRSESIRTPSFSIISINRASSCRLSP